MNRLLKYFFVIYIVIGTVTPVYSQNYADKAYYLVDSLNLARLAPFETKLIDSTLTIYHSNAHDTTKIKALTIIVEKSWDDRVWIKYNKWIHDYTEEKLLQQSFSANKEEHEILKKKWLTFHADALSNIGYALKNNGEFSEALVYYLKSHELIKDIDTKKNRATLLNNIGTVYNDQGNNKKALTYYFKSLKLNEEINEKEGMAISLNNIGYLFVNQDENSKALEYFEKSLKITEEIGNKGAIAHTLNNIGNVYKKQKDTTTALTYFERSLSIQQEISDKNGMASTLNNIGTLYKDKGNFSKALQYHYQSLNVSKETDNKRGMSLALNAVGNIYLKQGKSLKAEAYATESLKIAQEIGFPTSISAASEILTEVYQVNNNWEKAFQMYKLHDIMKDSLQNAEIEKSIIRQQANYEIEKKEQKLIIMTTQNELQELKLNKNKILINYFIFALILVLILTVVLYRGYQKKRLINELLESQKTEIIKKSEEKTAMLKEIHHRVKNNLQVVNSLLKLQSREIEDQKVLAIFKEAQNRVLSMALLHEKMYRSEDIKHIDLQEHISLLIDDLLKTYVINKNIQSNVKIANVTFGLQTLVPLGLIINEIISNALKHAFKDKDEGVIKVHLNQLNDEQYELIIGDNGIGSEELISDSGLGKKLIHTFAKQLKGSIERIAEEGTIYKLAFYRID